MSDSKESSSTNSINANEGNNDLSPEGLVDRIAQYNVEVTKDNTDNLNLNVMKKIRRNSKIVAKELKNWEDKLQEKSDEHEISLKEITDKNAEIEKMKLEITGLANKLKEKSDEHEISLKEIKDQNAEIEKMQLVITGSENKHTMETQELKEEVKKTLTENDDLRKRLKQYKCEYEKNLTEISDKDAIIEKMNREKIDLSKIYIEETNLATSRHLKEMDQIKNEKDNLKSEYEFMKSRKSISTTGSVSGFQQNNYFSCQDISDDSCTKKLKETEFLLQQKIIENKNLEKQLHSLSGTIEANQKEIQSLWKKNEELQNEIDELKCVSETRPP